MIRAARGEDAPALVEMGRAFFEEAGYAAEFEFDDESFFSTIAILAKHGLLLIAEKDGKAVGMAAVDVAPAYWNHDVMLAKELFWFVQKEYRQGIGRQMLRALEETVRSRGAQLFDLVAEEGKRSLALARVYTAGGFSPKERTFRKRLNLGA